MPPTIDYDAASDKLVVVFDYDPIKLGRVKDLPGRRYTPPERGGPFWTVPARMSNALAIRGIFGTKLALTPAAHEWGLAERERMANLMSVHGADTAELKVLPRENPPLYEFLSTRPYQLADVAFMASASCINACEPSLGKTEETIGAIYEAGLIEGQHLVIAPVTALEDTWETRLRRWCDDDLHIWVAHGDMREINIRKAMKSDEAFVIVTNPDTIRRLGNEFVKMGEWDTVTCDEFHLSGLSSPKNAGNGKGTVFFKAIQDLKAKRFWGLSGTPIGGKPHRLWPVLHLFDPGQFSSKWNWVDRWLDWDNGYQGHKTIKGIKPDLLDEFYEYHRQYLIRRTKKEVRKELPDKIRVDVWCDLTATQRKQYQAMATETEIRIDEEHLSATNVLALYTRLKQFATARQEIVKLIVKEGQDYPSLVLRPTLDSGKLPMLMENLLERGIGPENEGDAHVIIASQFRPWCEVIAKYLTEDQGVPGVELITGKVALADRTKAVRAYEGGNDVRVLVIQTQTGGTSLNLDATESVHIMDETWNPDDQTQVEDRGHRFTGLTVYTYRSKQTIEEYIERIGIDKRAINHTILDLRKKGLVHG